MSVDYPNPGSECYDLVDLSHDKRVDSASEPSWGVAAVLSTTSATTMAISSPEPPRERQTLLIANVDALLANDDVYLYSASHTELHTLSLTRITAEGTAPVQMNLTWPPTQFLTVQDCWPTVLVHVASTWRMPSPITVSFSCEETFR